MKRKRYGYGSKQMKNINTTTGMLVGSTIGIGVTGKIANEIPGAGGVLANNAIGTGFALAGPLALSHSAFGKGGIMDTMSGFGKSPQRRRRK